MTDDFIASLRNDWTSQLAPVPAVLRRARRGRFYAIVMLSFEIGSMVLAFAMGVWFGFLAVETGRLLLMVTALMLVAMSPVFALATWLVRRDSLHWEEETPAGVLRARRRQLAVTLGMLWLGWWAGGVAVLFVATLWALELGGLINERDFLVPYTASCAAIYAFVALWIVFRRRHVLAERAACDRMLAELVER